MNSLEEENKTRIGINEWFVPQISEHCPEYSPTRLENKNNWFNRPGKASTFTPRDGIAQEWITSADEISERIRLFVGRYKSSLVFRRRRIFEFSIKFSVSIEFKEVYS